MKKLLIANRGEIALRVMRAAAELGIRTAAVFSEDDVRSLHRRRADEAYALHGVGARAYLDTPQILAAAEEHGCDAVHPGYGFSSESSAFASSVVARGIVFVGPSPETLALLGDKTRARALASSSGVAVLRGTGAIDREEAKKFFVSSKSDAAMMMKSTKRTHVVAPKHSPLSVMIACTSRNSCRERGTWKCRSSAM
jgi:acetyl/propionyl-CoA carboxylase alpha subunit